MKLHNVVFILLICFLSCNANQNKVPPDGQDFNEVANSILSFNVYLNSYEVSDMDIDVYYQENSAFIKQVFPEILSNYDLTLYSQFSLSIFLYLEDERIYLEKLWAKHKHLKENEEFGGIVYLLEQFEITLD